MDFDLDLSSIKKIAVLPFSSESKPVKGFYKAHEWFVHLLRRDLMSIKSLCVDDYLDSNVEWDMEWNKIKENFFKSRQLEYLIKGIIEYDESESVLSIELLNYNGIKGSIEKKCATKDLLKVEKEVVCEIVKLLNIEPDEDEQIKISKLPDLSSLCFLLESVDANLRNGIKYRDAIINGIAALSSVPFMVYSVSVLVLDEFASVEDYEHMLPLCEKAIRSDPDDPQIYWRIARIYYEKKQIEKSLEYAEKGIELSPGYARNYIIAAQAYEELGNQEKSLGYGGMAVNLINTNSDV